MNLEWEIFHSLNCSLCKSPYSKSASEPKYPRQMKCGKAICDDCWMKEEPLIRKKRQHLRECDQPERCYCREAPPYFLLEILNHPSIVKSPNGNGYFLSESMDAPECPICQEEYSIDSEERKPIDLRCGHTFCKGCILRNRTVDPETTDWYLMKCALCNKGTCFPQNSLESKKNTLYEFLRELSAMNEQLEVMKRSGGLGNESSTADKRVERKETKNFHCANCLEQLSINQMFSCQKCTADICGACAFVKHREHYDSVISLLEKEAHRISALTQESLNVQFNGYETIFPCLTAQIAIQISNYKELLIEKTGNIIKMETHEKMKDQSQSCRELGDKFEQIAEEYLPLLRGIETRMKNLIAQFERKIS